MDNNILGNNIKFLRSFYGEKQSELADAIYLSPNAISQYENGKKQPGAETLRLISEHYKISISSLLHSNLENLYPNISREKIISFSNAGRIMFPIISSEDALKNQDFSDAFTGINQLYDSILNDELAFSEEKIIMLGEKCAKALDAGVIEAAASYIHIVASALLLLLIPEDVFIEDYLDCSILEYVRKNNLKRPAEEALLIFLENRKEFLDTFYRCLQMLQSSPTYRDIADHDIAVLYLCDLIDSGYTPEENYSIGCERIENNCRFGNPYSLKFSYLFYDLIGV